MVNLTLYDDKFDLSFGRALHAWAIVDQALGYWFEFLTDLPKERSDLIFYSNKSFEERYKLVFKLLEQRYPATPAYTKLKNKIKNYNERRNYLAHAVPALFVEQDSTEMQFKHGLYSTHKKEAWPLHESHLKEYFDSFVELYNILMALLVIMRNNHHLPEEHITREIEALSKRIASLRTLS